MVASPPPTNPTAVVFWNTRQGLLGTGSCRLYACKHGTISLTTNGGRTFRVVFHTAGTVESLETAGPDAAIAQIEGGPTLRTVDGGHTWHRFGRRYGASFATQAVGVGYRAYTAKRHSYVEFLWTENGGRTWQRRANGCAGAPQEGALLDLVTTSLGWVVCFGVPGGGGGEKAVVRTTDGGHHWSPAAGALPWYGNPAGIAFASNGFGLMWEGRGTLYVTRDGGASWRSEPNVARPEIDFGRGAAAFPDGRGFVLVGYGGALPARLLTTTDAGRTWQVVHRWR